MQKCHRELVLTVIPDANPIALKVTEIPKQTRHETGCIVWDAAVIQMLSTVLQHFPSIQGKKILELGCGCGIPGIALASAGAVVTLTERREMLDLVTENVQNNQDLVVDGGQGGSICIQELDWDAPDMNLESIGAPFDIVIGSELLYAAGYMDTHAGLLKAIAQAIGKTGTAILTQEYSFGFEDLFCLEATRDYNLHVEQTKVNPAQTTMTILMVTPTTTAE